MVHSFPAAADSAPPLGKEESEGWLGQPDPKVCFPDTSLVSWRLFVHKTWDVYLAKQQQQKNMLCYSGKNTQSFQAAFYTISVLKPSNSSLQQVVPWYRIEQAIAGGAEQVQLPGRVKCTRKVSALNKPFMTMSNSRYT